MRALCNREALLTACERVTRVVLTSSCKSAIDDSDFENLRVISLNDHGQTAGSSWLGDLFANCNPDHRIGFVALLVALCATLREENAFATIVTTYLFSMFVIAAGRSYGSKAGADLKDDSRAASKGPRKAGKLESAQTRACRK